MAVLADPVLSKIVVALAVTYGLARLMIWRRDMTEEAEEEAGSVCQRRSAVDGSCWPAADARSHAAWAHFPSLGAPSLAVPLASPYLVFCIRQAGDAAEEEKVETKPKFGQVELNSWRKDWK